MINWKKQSWVWQTASGYLLSKRSGRSHGSSILSMLGILLGVMTLLTVLSVMNGFQQNYIENINNVLSYHLRIDNQGQELDPALMEELKALPWVESITPFSDLQTIITGTVQEPTGGLIRGIPHSALEEDSSLKEHLELQMGELDLTGRRAILIGNRMARTLGLFPGDTVNLMNLTGNEYSRLAPSQEEFYVAGTFRTGYSEYDEALGFISLYEAQETMEVTRQDYGLKVNNRFRDRHYRSILQRYPGLEDCEITTWRDYNKAFFSALLMEKVMMILMVSLVFVVVALNIFHSLQRSVAERIEEIALFKAMGATPSQVRFLFILQGAILSFVSSLGGVIIGLLLSLNINRVFRAVEWVVNGVMGIFRSVSGAQEAAEFTIYSSRDFYLIEVPVVIMGWDVIVIMAAAVGFSLLAALMATRTVASIRPAEVFSYE